LAAQTPALAPGAPSKALLELFEAAVKVLMRSSFSQARLTREATLIALVSAFEGIVAKLATMFYERYPATLGSDTISLAELRRCGSVSETERQVVAARVEALLFQDVEKQIRFFQDRAGAVQIGPLAPILPNLIEIWQRRHLYVHNKGVVNRKYVSLVTTELAQKFGALEGAVLEAPAAYLLGAIDVTEIAAMGLIHACSHQWEQDTASEQICAALIAYKVYQGLLDQRYDYVKRLSTLLLDTGSCSLPGLKGTIVLNQAIALRDSNGGAEIEGVLTRVDWSSATTVERLGLHTLRGEETQVRALLPEAIATGELSASVLAEWPLFRPWREEPWFKELVPSAADAAPVVKT
jgi:hypothetical protein